MLVNTVHDVWIIIATEHAAHCIDKYIQMHVGTA